MTLTYGVVNSNVSICNLVKMSFCTHLSHLFLNKSKRERGIKKQVNN